MVKKTHILEELERIAQLLPTPFYWLDKDSVILGANEQALHGIGATYNGLDKPDHHMYWFNISQRVRDYKLIIAKYIVNRHLVVYDKIIVYC